MPSSSSSSEPSGIGLPQIAACLLIGYLFFRWYSSSPTSSISQSGAAGARAAPRRAPTAAEAALINSRAELVSGMFPQIPIAAIKWELQKNGASVEATTEKILTNGFLPEPPAPANPTPAPSSRPSRTNTPSATASGSTSATSSSRASNTHADLITRYNLTSKLATAPETDDSASAASSSGGTGKGKASAWSTNKAERQALLQKRRDDMILKARRRMEEQAAEAREEVANGTRQ